MAYLRCESNVIRRPRSADPSMTPGVHLKVEVGVTFPCQRSAPTSATRPVPYNKDFNRKPEPYLGYYAPGPTQYLHPNYPHGLASSRKHRAGDQGHRRPQHRDNRDTTHRRGNSEPRSSSNGRPLDRYALPHAQAKEGMPSFRVSMKKPLPPLPSSFRLGEDQLPWVTPEWPTQVQQYEYPTVVSIAPQNKKLQYEDPQRVRELEDLQQAMMTVNVLDDEEPGSHRYEEEGEEWEDDSIVSPLSNTPSINWALPLTAPDQNYLSPWDNPRYVPFSSDEPRRRSFTG